MEASLPRLVILNITLLQFGDFLPNAYFLIDQFLSLSDESHSYLIFFFQILANFSEVREIVPPILLSNSLFLSKVPLNRLDLFLELFLL